MPEDSSGIYFLELFFIQLKDRKLPKALGADLAGADFLEALLFTEDFLAALAFFAIGDFRL